MSKKNYCLEMCRDSSGIVLNNYTGSTLNLFGLGGYDRAREVQEPCKWEFRDLGKVRSKSYQSQMKQNNSMEPLGYLFIEI